MTTTAEPSSDVSIEIGTAITSVEQLDALPVGAVLRYRSPMTSVEEWYTKTGDDAWSVRSLPTLEWTNGHFSLAGDNVVESLPTEAAEPLKAGDTVSTLEQFSALPVGARAQRRGVIWTRTERGFVSEGGSHRSVENTASRGAMLVTFVPDGGVVEGDYSAEVQVEAMSLAEFKQRFRTTVLAAQQMHGVARPPVVRALRKLEALDCEPGPGMWVCPRDAALVQALPTGTLVAFGADPRHFEAYGLWGKTANGNLCHLAGGLPPDTAMAARVVSIPGREDSVWGEVQTSELEAIQAWVKQAWAMAMNVKDETGWCEELERAAARAGVGPWVEREQDLSPMEEVAALPVGAVVRYTSLTGDTALLKRAEGANNPAGTVHVGGVLSGHWTSQPVSILYDGRGTMRNITAASTAEMDSMPVGTVMTDGYSNWTKREPTDGSRRVWFEPRSSYGYTSTQWVPERIGYVMIP